METEKSKEEMSIYAVGKLNPKGTERGVLTVRSLSALVISKNARSR